MWMKLRANCICQSVENKLWKWCAPFASTKLLKQTDDMALITFTFMTTILLPLHHQLVSIKHIKWFSLVHIEFYICYILLLFLREWILSHKNYTQMLQQVLSDTFRCARKLCALPWGFCICQLRLWCAICPSVEMWKIAERSISSDCLTK